MADVHGITAQGPTASLPAAAAQVAAATTAGEAAAETTSARGTTTFSATVAPAPAGPSKLVQRLVEQGATVYGPRLARVPVPPRPDDVPRAVTRKPAAPMTAPRSLDGGRSPLAPGSLADARSSVDGLGGAPGARDGGALADAADGAQRMPSRHGLVAYTTTARGDRAYLTQERWLHIRDNHMDPAPQPRGKRTTTFWPTRHALEGPSMTDQEVIGVIVDAARRGTLRTEVRDTRMAEYDLPADQAERYGVSEAKVSMAPDGLVLSAYPGAGRNVLSVHEVDEHEQAALAAATAAAATAAHPGAGDDLLFRTAGTATSFG